MTTNAHPRGADAGRVTIGGVLRSEWRKLFGLRSTWWLLGVGLVLPTVFAVAQTVNREPESAAQGVFDAATQSSGASLFSVFIIAIVLGTLTSTTEFETRSITVTMAAVPSRIPVVLAKAGVVFVVGIMLGFVAALIAYVVGVALRGDEALIVDGYAFRALAGIAFYEGCIAAIAVSIGFLVRSTIGSIAVTFAFLFIAPSIISIIPIGVVQLFADTIPGTSASPLYSAEPDPGGFGVVGAALCVAAWTIVAVAVAGLATRRRDI